MASVLLQLLLLFHIWNVTAHKRQRPQTAGYVSNRVSWLLSVRVKFKESCILPSAACILDMSTIVCAMQSLWTFTVILANNFEYRNGFISCHRYLQANCQDFGSSRRNRGTFTLQVNKLRCKPWLSVLFFNILVSYIQVIRPYSSTWFELFLVLEEVLIIYV